MFSRVGLLRPPMPENIKSGATRTVDAELAIGFATFHESYMSEVSMHPDDWVSARAKQSSLFKQLSTTWHFHTITPEGTAPRTKVKFELQFEFANPFYATLTGQIFEKLSASMIEAFRKRAEAVYGHRT
ncbi:hypothetical protein MVES1_000483 [Malassezia vespertilionis]|uniref:uncharacterized protein n=1 Tax=Malassezia vespertilionis TaxID=2020962 RepID=UPI0024B07DD9|nr:uncharacterized protein MVES1_000483 [Malassezia vespertilionis]WFD05157.1 hypothetical protein MVES1_000483 [Malassezia vespertilionis]